LRIRPELSLDYPSSDIVEITERKGGFDIVTTFMGLYGISSPLPTFFTEDLLDNDWEEETASRDFLDIIHHHLYPMLYRAWLKYRFSHNVVEEKNESYWNILFSLIGLNGEEFKSAVEQPHELLPYLGILVQKPRSALGLKTILKHYLKTDCVDIEPCLLRQVTIPGDQMTRLGAVRSQLGNNITVGQEIADRMGSFAIRIGPLSGNQFLHFLHDESLKTFLRFIINFYLMQPLQVFIVLVVEMEEITTANCGSEQWSSLGMDTWLTSGDEKGMVEVPISL